MLVVDDEPAVADAVARALRLEGYDVSTAGEGLAALGELERGRPDALVLDVMMPRMDGLEVARELRARGDTAADPDADRARLGRRPGGGPRRRRRRLPGQAVRPRGAAGPPAGAAAAIVGCPRGRARCSSPISGSIRTRALVRRGDREIETTRTEYLLLELFLRNPRRVLTRSTIFEAVWGYDFGYASNSLDVYIGYLRRKTEVGGRATPDPHPARRRLRPPGAMSFRARLMLLVAAAVALAVGLPAWRLRRCPRSPDQRRRRHAGLPRPGLPVAQPPRRAAGLPEAAAGAAVRRPGRVLADRQHPRRRADRPAAATR